MNLLSDFEINMVSGGGLVGFIANIIGAGLLVVGPATTYISCCALYAESNPRAVMPGENRFTALYRRATYKPADHAQTLANCYLGIGVGLVITYVGYKLWYVE